jgi:streptogramin lyase
MFGAAVLLGGTLTGATALSVASAQTSPVVTNYTGTGINGPEQIVNGQDGALWFTNNSGSSIGRVTTAGTVSNFTGATIEDPTGIAAGPDGGLWFTNLGNNSIGRITTSGVVSNFTDPSIFQPESIAAGSDGALWFTNCGQCRSTPDSIGRISTAGVVTNYTGSGIDLPDGITAGPDGALWFVNLDNNSIGRITTAGAVSNFTGGGIDVPSDITTGPDGALWFTNLDSIGRITTAGVITTFSAPGLSDPENITSGPDGALWFTAGGGPAISAPSMVGRITTSGAISEFSDATIARPEGITSGPDGALWFTNNSNNSIGRITAPTASGTATTTAASTNPTSVTVGGAVTYTASVTSTGGTPTGTVTFLINGATLCTTGPLASSVASCSASSAPAGVDTISAEYSGDASFAPSIGLTSLSVTVPAPRPPAGATASNSATGAANGGQVTATEGNVSAQGVGPGAITVATYGPNPSGVTLANATGAYYDVALGTGSNFSVVTITVCNPGSGTSFDFFNGTAWVPFSDQSIANGCLIGTVTPATVPTLSQLTGTIIGVVTTPVPVSLAPNVTGISPVSGTTAGGTLVTFTGSHFTGVTAVDFGSSPAATVLVNSDSVMTAVSPAEAAGTVTVSITGPNGTSVGGPLDQFTYVSPTAPGPSISSISPSIGSVAGGTAITINGANFASTPAVEVGSSFATDVTLISSSEVTAVTPAGSQGVVGIQVQTATGVSNQAFFTYVVPATVPPGEPVFFNSPAQGYWLVARDGGIFSFDRPFLGSTGNIALAQPIVGMAETGDGGGYWFVAADGGVFSFGDAGYYGSVPGLGRHVKDVVGMVADPATGGYWVIGADGSVWGFNAPQDGDLPIFGFHVNDIVGGATTPDGGGLYLVGADGHVYTLVGDDVFQGDASHLGLNAPIVGMALDPATGGYWLLGRDGGVFSFDAPFFGSTGNLALNEPVVGMEPTADGQGYWFVASDGGVFSYGDAVFHGSTGNIALNQPVVGMGGS